jgi:hypothetical protein
MPVGLCGGWDKAKTGEVDDGKYKSHCNGTRDGRDGLRAILSVATHDLGNLAVVIAVLR